MEKVRQWPGLDIYQSWAQGKNNSAKPSSNPQRSQEEPDLKLGQGGIRYQSLFRRLLRQHVPLSPSFLASSLYCGWEIDWYNREILENPKPTQRILCQNRSSGLPLVHLCLTDLFQNLELNRRPRNLLDSYRTHKDESLEATFQNNRAIAALFQSISLRMPIPLSSFFRLKEFIPAYPIGCTLDFEAQAPTRFNLKVSSFSIFFKDDLGSAKELWYEVWKHLTSSTLESDKQILKPLIFSKS